MVLKGTNFNAEKGARVAGRGTVGNNINMEPGILELGTYF